MYENRSNWAWSQVTPAERQRLQETKEKPHSQEPPFVYAQLGSPWTSRTVDLLHRKASALPEERLIDSVKGLILGDPGAVSRVGRKGGTKVFITGERAPGYRLSPDHFQKFKRSRLLIGHKKCFVLLCPIGEHISMCSFCVFLRDGYCLDHALSSLCTKEMHAVRKLSVWYKFPIWSN